jgi:uncharacterized protein (TIGR02145 family)
MNKIEQIKDLKFLLDNGALNQEQYLKLLNEIIDKSESTVAFNNTNEAVSIEEISDYESVTIGNQVWMTENLNVKKFRNGDLIAEAQNGYKWNEALRTKTPAWCYYDDDPFNGENYGLLYNYYAVHDSRGLSPLGWIIPTWGDINYLTSNIEAERELQSRDGWSSLETVRRKPASISSSELTDYHYDELFGIFQKQILISGGNGTNKSGLNLRPGGFFYYDEEDEDAIFVSKGLACYFWLIDSYKIFTMGLSYFDGAVSKGFMNNEGWSEGKEIQFNIKSGYSVRCKKQSLLDISDNSPLFREAAEIIVKNQRGSASFLQSKLGVDYVIAERLMKEMEDAGIVYDYGDINGPTVKISDLNELYGLIGLPEPAPINSTNLEEKITTSVGNSSRLAKEVDLMANFDEIAAKSVYDFGLYDPRLDLNSFKFPPIKFLEEYFNKDNNFAIEIQNNYSDLISAKSLIGSVEFQKTLMELPIALGKSASDETFLIDLVTMPNLLILNNTYQEKSNILNLILSSLFFKKHPAELKLILIDPKKTDFLIYREIERLYLSKTIDSEDVIVTDKIEVISTLKAVCEEMNNRYSLLSDAFCNEIIEYNNKFKERKLRPDKGYRFLPYIIIIINDFEYLTVDYADYETNIEVPINQIIDKAKKVGIHLIITVNNSSQNILITNDFSKNHYINKIKVKITTRFNIKLNSEGNSTTNDFSENKFINKIKEKMPNRINFNSISENDLNTKMDAEIKERLIGKELIFSSENTEEHLQCGFINKQDIINIIDFICRQKGYATAYLIPG